jgi:carboxyl-terminal processing protease
LYRDVDDPAQVYPLIDRMLALLGDDHSHLILPDAAERMTQSGAPTEHPVVKCLSKKIGYLSVPGFEGIDRELGSNYARELAKAIGHVPCAASAGWIIDLRQNTGGNMWPMLGGLKPFLGSSRLGSFMANGHSYGEWHAGDNLSRIDIEMPRDLRETRVAVLLGDRTASSGEAVAIAFSGRQNTRSFGQPTAGFANANQLYAMPDGSQIALTVAVDADRNGKVFGDRVVPDQITLAADHARDPTLDAALAWLHQPH